MASGFVYACGLQKWYPMASLGIAINALQSAASGHSFMGINGEGQVSVITNPR